MTISFGVIDVTSLIPEGKKAFAFIITGGTCQAHFGYVWKNLGNGAINVSFKLWSDFTTVIINGTVSGILLCI